MQQNQGQNFSQHAHMASERTSTYQKALLTKPSKEFALEEKGPAMGLDSKTYCGFSLGAQFVWNFPKH